MIRRIVRDEPWGPWTGALLFAVHPIHVEAVAWVSALPDIACAGFLVASLWTFVIASDARRPGILHVAGAASFLAAVLFKEPAALLPVIVAMIDLARRPVAASGFYWISRYGGLALAALTYTGLRLHALGAITSSSREVPLMAVLKLAGTAAWQYTRMLLFPYPLNVAHGTDSALTVPWWAALLGFVVALIIAVVRRSVPWTAAVTTFGLPLIPALVAAGVLQWDNPWAERYAYVPSVGLAIAVGVIAGRLAAVRTRLLAFVAIPVLVVSAAIVLARTEVWRDDLTLWTDAVAKAPRSGTAHLYLGHALLVRGDIDHAVAELKTAVALKPGDPDALVNLGAALAMKGLHEAAIPMYTEALRVHPRDAIAHADLAISLSSIERQAEAYDEARRAVELRPHLAKGHLALGMALGNAGDIAGAATAFRRATELDPTDEMSRANLARAESILRTGAR